MKGRKRRENQKGGKEKGERRAITPKKDSNVLPHNIQRSKEKAEKKGSNF